MNRKTLLLLPLTILFCSFGNKNIMGAKAASQWQVPCDVKIVDEAVLNSLIDPRADGETEKSPGSGTYYKRETYKPEDRQWQGLVATASTGKRLWATWYTGGVKEPDPFNYVVVAYSDDNGKNWVDPYVVIDHEDPERVGVSAVLPHFFMDGDDLVLHYLSQYLYYVRFSNPDADNINDVVVGEAELISDIKIHKSPTVLTDEDGAQISVVAYETRVGFTENVGTTYIDVWDEATQKFVNRGRAITANPTKRRWPESQVVELEIGRWMVVSRIEGGTSGGVEVSISEDYGYTWSDYKDNLGEPFIGPGSKGHIMKLSSGNILVINHDTTSARSSLCAYLSLDQGQTFPYKLSIDGRSDVSYPSAFEKDGFIYVTWDKGRYLEKELRISKITEQDIIDGEVSAAGTFEKRIINKLNSDYTEIVSINNSFERIYNVIKGTPSSTIRDTLPTTFIVTDNDGVDHTLTGVWRSAGYKPDVPGRYYFTFMPDNISSYLGDPYLFLRVKVTVETNVPDRSNNTAYIIGGIALGFSLLAGSGAAISISRKKKKK